MSKKVTSPHFLAPNQRFLHFLHLSGELKEFNFPLSNLLLNENELFPVLIVIKGSDFPTLPRVHAHLYKGIPTQAGMGGGSSDCGYMITLLNKMFRLGLSEQQMINYAAHLGADCAFFITSRPAYAEGIGEKLQPITLDLNGWYIAVVRPAIPVPTKEAFSLITPHHPAKNCRDIVMQPLETWREELVNDFEQSVFSLHPEIGAIKDRLYEMGAAYAAMSGSGSSLFGLFRQPVALDGFDTEGTFTACLPL